VFASAAGGTSFASPAMAGIQALVNQKMGGAQGNPNYTYYKLAAAEQGAKGTTRCKSGGGMPSSVTLPAPECTFNDVTIGDIAVDCNGTDCFGATGSASDGLLSTSTTTASPAYPAGTGWDYATGLGTVNAYNLVHAWSQ
jgi:subtilase family serine protease